MKEGAYSQHTPENGLVIDELRFIERRHGVTVLHTMSDWFLFHYSLVTDSDFPIFVF